MRKKGFLAVDVHSESVATDGALKTCPESFRECELETLFSLSANEVKRGFAG